MLETLIPRLGIALGIGLLVGLERGWRERNAPAGSRTAGVRTYTLIGLLGGVLAATSQALSSGALFGLGFAAFAIVFAWFARREAEHDQTFSVTGVVAALAVLGLGGLAVAGDVRAAAAGGVGLAVILASREMLHGLLRRISWIELRSALLLAGMTVVVLPFMPNRAIDPWGGVNPWQIWFFTVLTAAISFGGYIAMRMLGPGRGVLVSGLVGAIVSSTAVTVAFARRASAGEAVRPLAAGGVLASMVSVLRVLAIVTVVKPDLGLALAPPALAAALVFGGIGGALLARGAGTADSETKLGNPFDLGPLLLFAASFAVVAAAGAALTRYLGAAGVILTSGLAGTFDVDVAALSAARAAGETVPVASAAAAVLFAIALNSAAKVVVAFATGPSGFALPLLGATVAAVALGGAAFLALAPGNLAGI